MANQSEKNLIPFDKRTESEQRELASKGGIASGEARREKGRIRQALEIALEKLYSIDGEEVKGYDGIVARMVFEALNGNVQAFKEIRDTVGEKPKDEVDMGVKFNNGGLSETLEELRRKD